MTSSVILKLTFLVLYVIITSCVAIEMVRYDNYAVYKIVPRNIEEINVLKNLQENDVRFNFWNDPVPSADFVTVMSSQENRGELENFLKKNNIESKTTITNVQDYIDNGTMREYTKGVITSMTWEGFYRLNGINDWLDDLLATYPSVLTEIIGGVSYEGRDIKGLKLSHGAGRRAIVLEGGIHAREWISPSAVCFILNELLTSDDEQTMAAARDFDWYIFPVTNPDGYVWTYTVNRMWRKNTRPIGGAFGVDLNRNWNNNWLEKGASSNPAQDIYAGPGPFSEIETRSLSQYLRTIRNEIDMYLSFHSFSQMLLLPFGNSTEHYANYDDALNIGRRAMGALSVRYGTQYVTGTIAEVIYEATGGSIDWVKGHLNVPLVYCYELRDLGNYGFIMPDDEILPNNLETMDSVLDLIHQAKRFNYLNSSNVLHASIFLLGLTMTLNFFQ